MYLSFFLSLSARSFLSIYIYISMWIHCKNHHHNHHTATTTTVTTTTPDYMHSSYNYNSYYNNTMCMMATNKITLAYEKVYTII